MFGSIDWELVKEKLYSKVGTFAVIDWTDLDKFLGTNVKKIYIYSGKYIVSEKLYNKAEVEHLKKFIPVVDLTEGRPFPEEFEKVPNNVAIFGRLNLIDLNL